MQVRQDPNADWEFLYGGIEGFDFEPGFFYELEVEIHLVKDPPADASTRRYVLRSVVSKIAEDAGGGT